MKTNLNRRQLIAGALTLGLGVSLESRSAGATTTETTQLEPEGFFTLGKEAGHWWLIDQSGEPFFSLGMNHIDPASLRYPENIHLWRDKYDGSTLKWIQESVAPNLKKWGFNSVGWVQEVTVRKWRHSRPFTVDEYKALNMPYCHLLPFMESHQWEKHTVHYNFFSTDWEERCDYIARAHCAELASDPNLIGYFYSDCPTWTHDRVENKWRGPIFDPQKLDSQAGRLELKALAHQYYKTTHDAIRRHDKHHLILGDRYEANAHIAMPLIEAALPFIDVLSFQDFRDPLKHLDEWHKRTGKPVLLADAAGIMKGEDDFTRNDGTWYAEVLDGLLKNPGCVGFHLCGAYQRNKARRRGLLDEFERPDEDNVKLIRAANERVTRDLASRF